MAHFGVVPTLALVGRDCFAGAAGTAGMGGAATRLRFGRRRPGGQSIPLPGGSGDIDRRSPPRGIAERGRGAGRRRLRGVPSRRTSAAGGTSLGGAASGCQRRRQSAGGRCPRGSGHRHPSSHGRSRTRRRRAGRDHLEEPAGRPPYVPVRSAWLATDVPPCHDGRQSGSDVRFGRLASQTCRREFFRGRCGAIGPNPRRSARTRPRRPPPSAARGTYGRHRTGNGSHPNGLRKHHKRAIDAGVLSSETARPDARCASRTGKRWSPAFRRRTGQSRDSSARRAGWADGGSVSSH